jgi:hypothetical protein
MCGRNLGSIVKICSWAVKEQPVCARQRRRVVMKKLLERMFIGCRRVCVFNVIKKIIDGSGRFAVNVMARDGEAYEGSKG